MLRISAHQHAQFLYWEGILLYSGSEGCWEGSGVSLDLSLPLPRAPHSPIPAQAHYIIYQVAGQVRFSQVGVGHDEVPQSVTS